MPRGWKNALWEGECSMGENDLWREECPSYHRSIFSLSSIHKINILLFTNPTKRFSAFFHSQDILLSFFLGPQLGKKNFDFSNCKIKKKFCQKIKVKILTCFTTFLAPITFLTFFTEILPHRRK